MASLNEADIAGLGQGINKLVATLNLKLDRLAVGDISDELVALLKDADATMRRIDQVIDQAPVDQALGNIASAAGRVDALLADPGLAQTVDNVAAFTARLRALAASRKLDRIVKHLDEAIERADALLGDNQYDVRVIIQDLRATADNVRTLSEYLKRNPAGILMGGPPEKIQLPAKESR
jgi:ABC-type transporter Mla subunit MlaD